MNKPSKIRPDDIEELVGPFDENGEPLWTPEMQARMDAIRQSPEMLAVRKRIEADAAAGKTFYTTEEVEAHSAEFKREWLAARGR